MIYFLVITSLALTIGGELITLPSIDCGADHGDSIYLLYGWLRVISTTLILLQVFILAPYENMKLKSLTFVHFCWGLFNCVTTAGVEPSWVWYTPLVLVQVLVFGLYIIHRVFSTIEMPKDKYSENECYIVFSKPENFWNFAFCWFGLPVSSISVVSNGLQYCYKVKKNFHIKEYCPESHHHYLKVDFCDSHVREKLSKLYYVKNPEDEKAGREWSFIDNCCHAVLRLYPNKMNTILSFLPCVLAKQLMRYENDRQNNR